MRTDRECKQNKSNRIKMKQLKKMLIRKLKVFSWFYIEHVVRLSCIDVIVGKFCACSDEPHL
jgi:hypothetical protein